MLRETRYDALSLVLRPSRSVFVIHGSSKLTQASFPVLALQATNAEVRTTSVAKSLGDTLYKEHSTLHSLAGLCGL